MVQLALACNPSGVSLRFAVEARVVAPRGRLRPR